MSHRRLALIPFGATLRFIRTAITLLSLAIALPVYAEEHHKFTELPGTRALISQLRAGGFVLFMRHGSTDSSKPDQFPLTDLNDCSKQRPLIEEGRQVARFLGETLRRGRIPVDEVYAGPLCRTKETALAAFGNFKVNQKLMTTTNLTTEEKGPYLDELKRLLSSPVAKGNRVLVTHAPNLADLIGYFPGPEGVIVVFQPMDNGRFNYLATIPPAAWAKLIK